MLRTISLAVALFAFSGLAIADCGGAHSAKQTLTNDEQANASQAPTVAKTALPAEKKPTQSAKKPVSDKPSSDKPDKVAAANKD